MFLSLSRQSYGLSFLGEGLTYWAWICFVACRLIATRLQGPQTKINEYLIYIL